MDPDQTVMMDPAAREQDVGDAINGYQLGQLLGRGAHGMVFLATKPGDPRTYAVKVIDTDDQPAAFIERIMRECRITKALRHPGIITVHETGEWGPHIYIVMEVAVGHAANEHLADGLGWELSGQIARRVAKALDYAYSTARIIHRDVKPANIVIDIDGDTLRGVKVVDFGLSRSVDEDSQDLTMTGMVLGTPLYMSPEQARGERDLGMHTDIYALGATLFHLIAGRPPFNKGLPIEIMASHCRDLPPRLETLALGCPLAMADLVDRCLQKDPADRWESYAELITALDRVLGVDLAEAEGEPSQPTSKRYTHRALSLTPEAQEAGPATPKPAADAPKPVVPRFPTPRPSFVPPPLGGVADALGDLMRTKFKSNKQMLSENFAPAKRDGTAPVAPPAPPAPSPAQAAYFPVVRLPDGPAAKPPRPRPAKRPPSLAEGLLIDGSYVVLGQLGAGAMGEVYAVRDRVTGRDLALKMLSEEDMLRPGAVRRFQGEASALATVDHPAFPYFAGKGSHQGRDYLMMERVAGIDLRKFLDEHGPLNERDVLWVAARLASAMGRSFVKCGMIHRDIKPANLMVSRSDAEQFKIVDFGLSTYIDYGDYEDFSNRVYKYVDDDSEGKSVGTPAYMSPEQCLGKPAAPPMDIYAIGCTVFHLMTGHTPYQAPTAGAMMMKHLHDPPPVIEDLVEVSAGTAYLLKRCLAKDPGDRFKSYAQLAAACDSAAYTATTRVRRGQGIGRP